MVQEANNKVQLSKKALAEHRTAEQLDHVVAHEAPAAPTKRHGWPAVPDAVSRVEVVKLAVEALGRVWAFTADGLPLSSGARDRVFGQLGPVRAAIEGLVALTPAQAA